MTDFTIECIQGNIAHQPDMDAVVNAANAQLMPGGGVAGAIHAAAGPGLADECRAKAPIKPGEAVITTAHDMPNAHIIHCLGPVYGVDEPSDRLLADCYRNALKLADQAGLESVAFPAISAGAFGYPLEDGLVIAVRTLRDAAPECRRVRKARFVLFGEDDLRVCQAVLGRT
ncbi:macro domain-containing protein [uncultured Marinobacter sp.]|uniref:macro domain-containing protein n=1 Tax=uncultured Marinobacter sp. TaxID=187379 RepID=UPI0026132605|nr:macro domain-containing protein [uncultured Marinobacter sp.]